MIKGVLFSVVGSGSIHYYLLAGFTFENNLFGLLLISMILLSGFKLLELLKQIDVTMSN
jgi:hypothetical protein